MKVRVTLDLEVQGDDCSSLEDATLWQKVMGIFPPSVRVAVCSVEGDAKPAAKKATKKKATKKKAKRKPTRRPRTSAED